MGIFRVIFFLIFAYYLVKFIGFLFRISEQSSSTNANNNRNKSDVNIHQNKNTKSHPTDKMGGEYVDFEEVKD
jgi:hypothetical protein